MTPIIKATGLSKRYRIGKKRSGSLRETLSVGQLFSKSGTEEFWALKDISFEVEPGMVLGIIGKNGAGKSTLLKILSRITAPTKGKVTLLGRVSSVLEVGTGFHPELTGRENIFLNGSILGMKRAEILRKFDEIVAFSGIENFIDTRVKHYSSGMYVRLAFAVASHLEPEILIIDEVLAVGDAEFQKKCLGKMKDVSVQDGRTVLFVSHNMGAVQNLCNRALVLRKGMAVFDGNVENAISKYLNDSLVGGREKKWDMKSAPGNDKVKLIRAAVYAEGKSTTEPIRSTDQVVIEFDYYQYAIAYGLDLTFNIFDETGVLLCHIGTEISQASNPLKEGFYRTKTIFPSHILNTSTYTIEMWFGLNKTEVAYFFESVLTFTIEAGIGKEITSFRKFPGVIHPILDWQTKNLALEA